MSDEQKNTPPPESTPAPNAAPAPPTGSDIEGSKSYSEEYRGINIVNFAPVTELPEPGGLPSATSDPGGTAPATDSAPAEFAPAPASSEE